MKLKNILFLASLIIVTVSFAQKIEIGTIHQLYSKVLNEERTYNVFLPKHYNDKNFPNQKYPIIYLLDGEKYFHVVSGLVKNLSNGYYPQIPECIVVAIENINRSRDLTPTKVKLPYENGGGANFELFLQNELIPTINKNYRTLDYKILIGHSFGGLFVINTLLNNSDLFNTYIAIDPSLWWDTSFLVKNLQKNSLKISSNQRLFFANANSYNLVKTKSKQLLAHYTAKNKFIELATNNNQNEFKFDVKFYENEDHGSVVLPSLIDGLRSSFKGFKINVKELIKNPDLLEKNFANFSNELGFYFKPQIFYIDAVVDLAAKKKQQKNAEILHKINLKLYPENLYLKNK